MRSSTRHYWIGVLAGVGVGVFLALGLAEDGNLAAGIHPGSSAWSVIKFGGLVLAAVASVWQLNTRACAVSKAPSARADGGA